MTRSATWLTQAVEAHQQGHLQKARALYERVLKSEPRNVQALHLLGVLAAQTGHHQWAVDLIGRAIGLHPAEAALHNDLGNSLAELGRNEEAVASFDRAIALHRGNAQAYYNRGDALQSMGRLDEALASYDAAIATAPDFFEAHNNRGNVLRELDRHDEAAASYRRALELQPDDVDSQFNLARTFKVLGRLEEAVAAYQRTIELRPRLADACNDLGIVLKELGHPEAALGALNQALAADPDNLNAQLNRGNVLLDLERPEEALDCFDLVLNTRPDDARAHNSRGNALKMQGRIDDAVASYDRAIALKADNDQARTNKGMVLLAAARYREGWPLYEHGWNTGTRGKASRFAPDWDGTTRPASLLVLPEQGVGDQILHCSILPDVLTAADAVTVVVDPRLVGLFRRSFADEGADVIGRDEPIPSLAAQIYVGSLGRYFRNDESDFLRARVPYLRACSRRRSELRAALGTPDRLVCGLSWVSKAAIIGHNKSLSLQTLLPLLAIPDVTFVNLQYGDTRSERDELESTHGISLAEVATVDKYEDLDGLAALIDACDVVVTISNTTAHLAGALGKPTFLLLSDGSGLHWYWQQRRTDSPWYPTLRLFRQRERGRWDDVVAAVTTLLLKLQGSKA